MHREAVGRDGAERLGKIELFAELSTGQRQMLARLVDELSAEAGEQIMREGEYGHEFLVIESGTADVFQGGSLINALGPSDFMGELAILDGGIPRTATVVATTPISAIVLTAHFMRELRERWPSIGERIDSAADERRRRDERARSAES